MSRPAFDRLDLVAIAVGGLAGASLRWLITRTRESSADWFEYAPNPRVTLDPNLELFFPINTLIVNVLGCLVLGVLTALLARSLPFPRRLLIGAATGFCGSLTTFSAFAVEVAERLRGVPAATPTAGVDPLTFGPEIGAALTYVIISLVCGAAAFCLGRIFAQRIVDTPGVSTIGGGE